MGVAVTKSDTDTLTHVLGALHDAVHLDAAPADRVGEVTLHPHQREAVAMLRPVLQRFGGALLADPVGTGKTWSALGVAAGYARLLVVAPASLRSMWAGALARAGREAPFVSFEALSRGVPLTESFDLVIVDEAHHVRNPATQRFKALAEAAWGADILLLSATPLHNRAADLRALCSLFLGSGADALDPETLAQLICRRALKEAGLRLPRVSALEWLSIPDHADVLPEILGIPPPVPPADGGAAAALGTYVLVRQWCSSDAALVAALTRRLLTGAAMSHRLSQGRHPTRRELLGWMAGAGAVQLTLAFDYGEQVAPADRSIERLDAHLQAVRALRDRVRSAPAADVQRLHTLADVLARHASDRVVLFTHSIDTARMWFDRLSPRFRVACLDGRGGRVVTGRLPREEIVRAFRPGIEARGRAQRSDNPMRIDVLIATDVLSEGVDLHDANVVVHLDLPWTVARLDQRVGRLRRIGSPHFEVTRYAFQPPAAGNTTLKLLERLAAKAGLADTLVGVTPDSLERTGSSTGSTSSPADARDLLRELTRAWKTCRTERSPHRPSIAAVLSSLESPGALAAIAIESQPIDRRSRESGGPVSASQLVGILHDAVSVDPQSLLQLVRSLSRKPVPPPPHVLRRGQALLDAWIEAEQARRALLLDIVQRSDAHRGVLRALHRCIERAGRSMRHELLPLMTEVRALVLGATGIGAETALRAWLAAHPLPTPGDLHELAELLRSRAQSRPELHQPHRVLAMLLLVPDAG